MQVGNAFPECSTTRDGSESLGPRARTLNLKPRSPRWHCRPHHLKSTHRQAASEAQAAGGGAHAATNSVIVTAAILPPLLLPMQMAGTSVSPRPARLENATPRFSPLRQKVITPRIRSASQPMTSPLLSLSQ